MQKAFFFCYRLLGPKPLFSRSGVLLKEKKTGLGISTSTALVKHKADPLFILPKTKREKKGSILASSRSSSVVAPTPQTGTSEKIHLLVSPQVKSKFLNRSRSPHRGAKEILGKNNGKESRKIAARTSTFNNDKIISPIPHQSVKTKRGVKHLFSRKMVTRASEFPPKPEAMRFPPLTYDGKPDPIVPDTRKRTRSTSSSSIPTSLTSALPVTETFPRVTVGSAKYGVSRSLRPLAQDSMKKRGKTQVKRTAHRRKTRKRFLERLSMTSQGIRSQRIFKRKKDSKIARSSSSRKILRPRRSPSAAPGVRRGERSSASRRSASSAGGSREHTRPSLALPHRIPITRTNRNVTRKFSSSRSSSSSQHSKFSKRTRKRLAPFSLRRKMKPSVKKRTLSPSSVDVSLARSSVTKRNGRRSSSKSSSCNSRRSSRSRIRNYGRSSEHSGTFPSTSSRQRKMETKEKSFKVSTTTSPTTGKTGTTTTPPSIPTTDPTTSTVSSYRIDKNASRTTSHTPSDYFSSDGSTPFRLSEKEVDEAMDQIIAALSASDDMSLSDSSFSSFFSPPVQPSTTPDASSFDKRLFESEKRWWQPTGRDRVLQESALNPVGVQSAAFRSPAEKKTVTSVFPLSQSENKEEKESGYPNDQQRDEISPVPSSFRLQTKNSLKLSPTTVKLTEKRQKEDDDATSLIKISPLKPDGITLGLKSPLPPDTSSDSSPLTNALTVLPLRTSPVPPSESLSNDPAATPTKKPSRGRSYDMKMYSSVNHQSFGKGVQEKLRIAANALGFESMFWITRAQAQRTSNAIVLPGERATVIHLDVATVVPLLSLPKETQEDLLDRYPPFFGMGVGILSDRNKWKVVTAQRLVRFLNAKDEERVLYVDTRRADELGFTYTPKDVIDIRKASAVEVYNSCQLDDPYKGEPQRGVAINGITGKRFSQPGHDILLAVGLLRGYTSPMWVPERQLKYLNVDIKEECKKEGVMTYDMAGLIVPLSSLPKESEVFLLRLLKRKYPDAFKCDLFFLFGVNQWEASRSRALVKHMGALEDLKYPYFFVNVQEFALQFPSYGFPLYTAVQKIKPYGRQYIEAAAHKLLSDEAEAMASSKKKKKPSKTDKGKTSASSLEVLPHSLLFIRQEKLWGKKEVRFFFAEDATMRRFYNACCMVKPYLVFPSVRAIGVLNGRLVSHRDETILHMHALKHKFSSPLWLTTRTAEKMGVRILPRQRKKYVLIGSAAAAQGSGESHSEGFYNIEDFPNNEAILSMFPRSRKNMHFILDGKWRPVLGKYRQEFLSSLKFSTALWISMNECLMSGFQPFSSAVLHHFPEANRKLKSTSQRKSTNFKPVYNSQQTTDPVRVIGLSHFFVRPQGTSM